MKKELAVMSNKAHSMCRMTGLKIRKYSPEILLGVGIVGFIGTVVAACNATLEAEDIMEEYHEKLKTIDDAAEVAANDPENYSYDEEIQELDVKIAKVKTVGKLGKAYAPVMALGSVSLTCILVSRNIMQKRYLGAVGAFNAVSAAFETYRSRVRAEEGELMDRHYRYGTELEVRETVEIDENGKKHKVKEVVEKEGTMVEIPENDYARFFDSSNKNWDPNPEFCMMFLRTVQAYANDLLNSKGYVFLNDLYDNLGFPRTQAGCVVGWLKGDDVVIDFGIYNPNTARDFVNGRNNYILLDFNIPSGDAGIIWDKI